MSLIVLALALTSPPALAFPRLGRKAVSPSVAGHCRSADPRLPGAPVESVRTSSVLSWSQPPWANEWSGRDRGASDWDERTVGANASTGSITPGMEREVLSGVRSTLDERAVKTAVKKILLDVDGGDTDLARAGANPGTTASIVRKADGALDETRKVAIASAATTFVLASIGPFHLSGAISAAFALLAFVLASGDPLEEEGVGGAMSRVLGRYTLRSVDEAAPRVRAAARAAAFPDSAEVQSLQTFAAILEDENEKMRKDLALLGAAGDARPWYEQPWHERRLLSKVNKETGATRWSEMMANAKGSNVLGNYITPQMEQEAQTCVRADLDRRAVEKAVKKLLEEDRLRKEAASEDARKIAIASAVATFGLANLGPLHVSVAVSTALAVLAYTLADGDPLEEEGVGVGGAASRILGRFTLRSVDKAAPRVRAAARAVAFPDSDPIESLENHIASLMVENEALRNDLELRHSARARLPPRRPRGTEGCQGVWYGDTNPIMLRNLPVDR